MREIALLALVSCLSAAACGHRGNAASASEAGTNLDATGPGFGGVAFTIALSNPTVVSTYEQRRALGFRFGYVDGVLGAVNQGNGGYTFFVSGDTVAADAGTCNAAGATPETQGAYRVGVAPDSITRNFGCRALIADSERVAPDGSVTGPFDRDYVGGGPVLELTNGASRALVLIYHAEFHWGPTCNLAPCFYGTLGIAVSLDGGATFSKLGEIVQPAIGRADWITNHASSSLSIGAGPVVIGDESGAPVDPTTVNPASAYVYVFFDDYDTSNAPPCDTQQCVGIARASLTEVVNTAFNVPGAKASTALFSKYHTGDSGNLFGQPAASGSTDDRTAGGHYTAVLRGAFELSALYDRTIDKFLLAYKSAGAGAIQLRTSSNATLWPDAEVSSVELDEDGGVRYPSLMGEQSSAAVGETQPYLFYTNGLSDWRTSTFMSRRILVNPMP